MLARPHSSPLFPYTTLFRSLRVESRVRHGVRSESPRRGGLEVLDVDPGEDRKSTRLNSSHVAISYAVFCLKKKNIDRYIFCCVPPRKQSITYAKTSNLDNVW